MANMINELDMLRQRLDQARAVLKMKQDYFKMDMLNNLETDTYECNAMNALVVMAQIKAFIKELEFYISLQERRN